MISVTVVFPAFYQIVVNQLVLSVACRAEWGLSFPYVVEVVVQRSVSRAELYEQGGLPSSLKDFHEEGVDGSIACSLGYTLDFWHASTTSCFRISFCARSEADLLCGMSCFNNWGSLWCVLVCPCAAFFASSSALSFPRMPLWPGIQHMTMSPCALCVPLPSESCSCVTRCCPDAGFLSLVASIVACYNFM